ncbi:ubiquinol-cytochrome-c reductase complex assembly factor 2 [Hylaeus anthracinus]|uniref:ubiquinol-cytochrome-c reductase complex assembly factor 2 n=1 Tax=Hylaeus anthracinus TaxID=313031 RepID=UPI0023BA1E85|nr:ubiquinol-cytochrome-c reductase complex assembly factor 2 [Hylaeus anthracinus]
MAGTYRNYMKLLEAWPLDRSKPGRDLSQHIRDQVKIAFAKGETSSQLNREVCDRYYMSLKRITSNHYGQMYVRSRIDSASGLSREQCNLALAPELQEYFKEDNGIFSRTYSKIVNYYNAKSVST